MKTLKPAFVLVLLLLVLVSIKSEPLPGTATTKLSELKNKSGISISDTHEKLWQKANDLAKNIMIIDCHSHSLFSLNQSNTNNPKQITSQMLNKSGVKGLIQSFPVKRSSAQTVSENILNDIRMVQKTIADSSLITRIALRSEDFVTLPKEKKIATLIGLESFKGLCEGNLKLLQKYHDEGVRMIGLHNSGLDSLFFKNHLTQYGIDYIKELNRLGIICDITHMGGIQQRNVIAQSQAPVIISHSAAFKLINSDFNVEDSTLESLKMKKGIICVTFFSGQLSKESMKQFESGADPNKISRAKVEELVDQIDYLKKMIGIDFIGIGSDYGGSGKLSPAGLETIEGFPLIIYHLLKRNYSVSEIEKVMGLNFINFFRRVEEKSC